MTKYIALLAVLLGGFFTPAWGQNPPPGLTESGIAIGVATLNSSVTVTTGNTFQQALASNVANTVRRQSLEIQNNNTNTDSCWVFLGTTANATKAASIILAVGQAYTRYYPYVPDDAVQVTCAGNSDTVYIGNN